MNSEKQREIAGRYARVLQAVYSKEQIGGRFRNISIAPRFITFDINLRFSDSGKWKKALELAPQLQVAGRIPNVTSRMYEGAIRYDFTLKELHWIEVRRDMLKGLQLGIGPGNLRPKISLEKHGGHTLITGGTGSGKTVFIKNALISLRQEYDPSELKIFICAPHIDGYDKQFLNFDLLGAPIAYSYEEIQRTLSYVFNEYKHRKSNGFVLSENPHLPRLLLILDESQEPEVLGSKKSGFNESIGPVGLMAKGARKFGINLWITSHRPRQEDLPGIFDQLINRYIGLVDSAKTANLLTGRAISQIPNVMHLTGNGDMVYVAGAQCERFISANPQRSDYEGLPRSPTPPLLHGGDFESTIEEKDTSPGPDAAPLDDTNVLGFYLAYRSENGAWPGKVVVKNKLGLTEHYHRRYRSHIFEMLRQVTEWKKILQTS